MGGTLEFVRVCARVCVRVRFSALKDVGTVPLCFKALKYLWLELWSFDWAGIVI
jgi:hypothetical protein